MSGSEHNDEFYIDEHGKVRTRTNRSGGIQVFICFIITSNLFLDVQYDGQVSISALLILSISILTIRVEFPMGKS